MYLSHDDYRSERDFSADVVVVGTGAGGAAAGAALARDGRSVVFVEEGSHSPTSSFNPYVRESVPRLYRDAAATVLLGKPWIPFVEGRCVGGSTVVNGGMSYRAPERVLENWEARGLCGPRALEPYYEEVEAAIHVAPQHPGSVGRDSYLMTEGARRLGWRVTVNQRNQAACVGSNNCSLGCPTGAKQSTLVTYMPDALRHGAQCLTELRVERLLVERGRCVGVRGRTIDPVTRRPGVQVTVRGRATVVAGGAVQTPLLLQAQLPFRRGGALGRHLTCHPNAKVVGVYPFDVRAWQGVSQNAQIKEFEDQGLVFAENCVPPAVLATQLPALGNAQWELMQRYNNLVVSGVLMEDSTSGSVRRRFGQPFARYSITHADCQRLLRGIEQLGVLHFTMGADELWLPLIDTPRVRDVDALRRATRRALPADLLELFTVHLMGTARMGASPRDSVTDPLGQLWELPGCYIADASLLPSALGVNPQLTIMALATHVARHLQLH